MTEGQSIPDHTGILHDDDAELLDANALHEVSVDDLPADPNPHPQSSQR